MKKIAFILLFFAFVSQPAVLLAQPDLDEIDRYLSSARQEWMVPGMAVAIVKDGQVVMARGYGIKEAEKPGRVDENTVFAIASNTKGFTASLLATLVDREVLSWDDKVRNYLPEFELYDAYASGEATVRDLLCHRLGLGTFSGDLMWYKSTLSPRELIQKFRYVPQAYSFRGGYGYSNLMFIAAGEVIRSASGKPWEEYAASTFFEPLGMTRTITSTEDLQAIGNFAMPHKPYEDGNQVLEWVNWDTMGAAGGIISSARDMASWMIMHLNGGVFDGDTLLSAEQQNILWTPHNNFVMTGEAQKTIPGRHFSAYGLGWALGDYYGRKVISHSGGYDGMYSRVMMVPDEQLGITILTNSMKGIALPLCYYIVNQYIGEDNRDWSGAFLARSGAEGLSRTEELKNARVKRSKPTLSPEQYAGTYHSHIHGKIIVAAAGKDLRLEFENAPALGATLTHWHYDTWEIHWDEPHAWFDFGLVRFKLDAALKVTGMHFDVPNYDIFFDEVDPVKTD